LPLSIHEVIDDERTIGLGEKFAKADGARRSVASLEVARALFKWIILNLSALREMAAQLRDAFAVAHKFNFGQSKLLALSQILARFVSQIGLPKGCVNGCMYHGWLPPEVIFSPAATRGNLRLGWPHL